MSSTLWFPRKWPEGRQKQRHNELWSDLREARSKTKQAFPALRLFDGLQSGLCFIEEYFDVKISNSIFHSFFFFLWMCFSMDGTSPDWHISTIKKWDLSTFMFTFPRGWTALTFLYMYLDVLSSTLEKDCCPTNEDIFPLTGTHSVCGSNRRKNEDCGGSIR